METETVLRVKTSVLFPPTGTWKEYVIPLLSFFFNHVSQNYYLQRASGGNSKITAPDEWQTKWWAQRGRRWRKRNERKVILSPSWQYYAAMMKALQKSCIRRSTILLNLLFVRKKCNHPEICWNLNSHVLTQQQFSLMNSKDRRKYHCSMWQLGFGAIKKTLNQRAWTLIAQIKNRML